MAGKFSQPRPHRDEERQIEETFRKVTTQGKVEYTPQPAAPREEPVNFPFPEADPVPESQQPQFIPVPQEPKAQSLEERVSAFFDEMPDLEVEEEAPPEPQEQDLVDKLMDKWEKVLEYAGKNRRVVLITLCALAVVMIFAFMGVLFGSFSDPYGKKILNNVTILDVQVGGMTKKEATAAVKRVADNVFAQPMVVSLSGNEIALDTTVKFHVKAAVEAAYDYGRGGTNAENQQAYLLSQTQTYAVPLTGNILEVDESAIRTALSAYAEGDAATLVQTAYGLEGTQPELSAETFNANAPVQTLVITMGTPGVGFDIADVTAQVVESFRNRIFRVEVENVSATKEPDPIDLRAIWEEFNIDPIEATFDPSTNQAIPGSYGYTFDLENAKKLVAEAQFGEEIRIPMEYVEPELLDASAFFRDVLGEHQTRQTSHDARNTNLRLACEAISGTVIEPGESFSFNTATGQRTAAKGYQTAPNDTTPYTTEFVAGGVSQVSSTLFYAAVVSGMEFNRVTPGKYAPGFIEFGMDAMVGDTTDFGFRNPHSYPVRIEAQLRGGYVTVRILGTEERSHYILVEQSVDQTIKPETTYEDFSDVNPDGWLDGDVVQEGITGYVVKTYCVFYDRQSNTQTKRNLLSTTNYQSEDRILAKVEVPETTEATEPPTQPPTTEAPTTQPPTTEAPTVATQPPTVPPTEATVETITPPDETPQDDAAA